MSKIYELKLTIGSIRVARKAYEEAIQRGEAEELEVKKEIAALEAEASKPREWALAIDAFGKIAGIAEASIGGIVPIATGSTFPINTITVIEKKPFRLTGKMTEIFWRTGGFSPTCNSEIALEMIRAIGIDAIAAD